MGVLSTVIGFFRRAIAAIDGNRKKPVKSKPKARIRKRIFTPESPEVGARHRVDLRHDDYLHSAARRQRREAWAKDRPGETYPFDKVDYWGP